MNRKEVALLALVIFLSVVSWIAFDIFHIRNQASVSSKESQQVIPLTPTFDNDILKGLKVREE